jgi:hypothetical protein
MQHKMIDMSAGLIGSGFVLAVTGNFLVSLLTAMALGAASFIGREVAAWIKKKLKK